MCLYWLSYPFFEYATVSSYISEVPQYFTFYSNSDYSVINLLTAFILIFLLGVHFALIIGGSLAVYWSEFIQSSTRKKILNFIEILTNIPLVVYGYLLLVIFSRVLDLDDSVFQNMLVTGVILGGMILPQLVFSITNILQSIPYNQREGAYSLGASRYRTAIMVLIPSQVKLFIAALINIVTRAVAEILIVLLLAGFTTEIVEVIVSIIIISIISTTVSQALKKSHGKDA
jgi:phosphate transport system permease protein